MVDRARMVLSPFLLRREVVNLTGLNFRAIRRLEKRKRFPARVPVKLAGSGRSRIEPRRKDRASENIRRPKVRWRRHLVLDWIERDEAAIRQCILKALASGTLADEREDVSFHAPPGFVFKEGAHIVTFRSRPGLRLWSGVWNNRDLLSLKQCQRPCRHCQRQNVSVFSNADEDIYLMNEKDVRRYL